MGWSRMIEGCREGGCMRGWRERWRGTERAMEGAMEVRCRGDVEQQALTNIMYMLKSLFPDPPICQPLFMLRPFIMGCGRRIVSTDKIPENHFAV